MEVFTTILNSITEIFKWWIIVTPWERGLRVRFGKHVKLLEEGVYFKLPFFDLVFKQSIRLRVVELPVQTVTTKDGKTLTVAGIVSYKIDDIFKLHNTLHQPENTISNIVLGRISDHISKHDLIECTPGEIERVMKLELKKEKNDFGIDYDYVKIVSHAEVRTYRIIGDSWMDNNLNLDEKK